eukprot:3150271-Alexandrium_andersonii.AAC.1
MEKLRHILKHLFRLKQRAPGKPGHQAKGGPFIQDSPAGSKVPSASVHLRAIAVALAATSL